MNGKEARGDFSNKRKDGKIIDVEGSASPILDDEGSIIGFLGIQRDITERKLDHQSVKASRDQLRQLATRLEHVREEERAGIAREIHDELGQDLTAVKMNVSWLARKLKSNELLQKKLQHVQDLVDIAIQAVRRIATQLRPAVLDELGLGAAIEWQAQKFTMDSHIKCVVNLDPAAIPLSREVSTALFRIFQEALTNVERHANATNVKVKLATFGKSLYLEVTDDGRGIHTKQLNDPRSIGLLGMKERALALGGEVTFTSVAGSGTTVTATIPLRDS
jgi:signal transduction histidine kinase